MSATARTSRVGAVTARRSGTSAADAVLAHIVTLVLAGAAMLALHVRDHDAWVVLGVGLGVYVGVLTVTLEVARARGRRRLERARENFGTDLAERNRRRRGN